MYITSGEFLKYNIGKVGYYHSVANSMTNAAVGTGFKATFDEATQEVMVNGKVFKF